MKKNLFCTILNKIFTGIFIVGFLFVVIGAYFQNKIINYDQVIGVSETDYNRCTKIMYRDDNVYHYKYFCDTVIIYQDSTNKTYILNTEIKFLGSLPDKNQTFTVNYDK